jgi:hypothetical protein
MTFETGGTETPACSAMKAIVRRRAGRLDFGPLGVFIHRV